MDSLQFLEGVATVMVVIASGIYLTEKVRSEPTKPESQPNSSPSGEDNQDCPSSDFAALINAINTQGDANRKEDKSEDKWKKFLDVLTLIILCSTLYFLGCTYYAIKDQVEEMKKAYSPIRDQANTARDTETRQLRAYLTVSAGQSLTLSDAGDAAVPLIILNNGQTPAYHVKWKYEFSIAPGFQWRGLNDITCETIWRNNLAEANMGILAKGIEKAAHGKISQSDLTHIPATRKLFSIDGMLVYLAGRVCYEDVFRHSHWTDFCVEWKGTGSGHGDPEYCDKGANEGDREPMPDEVTHE